jgi:hypothetical protein
MALFDGGDGQRGAAPVATGLARKYEVRKGGVK